MKRKSPELPGKFYIIKEVADYLARSHLQEDGQMLRDIQTECMASIGTQTKLQFENWLVRVYKQRDRKWAARVGLCLNSTRENSQGKSLLSLFTQGGGKGLGVVSILLDHRRRGRDGGSKGRHKEGYQGTYMQTLICRPGAHHTYLLHSRCLSLLLLPSRRRLKGFHSCLSAGKSPFQLPGSQVSRCHL
ncbi:hypothetical protein KP509_15G032200 [Ceratopteris richardii]|uniref:Uncharacterized protein n=1 Tax=Ceratopteris richardii TaxID=49495 RepID=A0A8T2T879_CERRI|nr:hypothetical protein KP509_15G032200 [Ceratopteris richardii]